MNYENEAYCRQFELEILVFLIPQGTLSRPYQYIRIVYATHQSIHASQWLPYSHPDLQIKCLGPENPYLRGLG